MITTNPVLPWWGRGVIAQLAAFLTLNFWIGVSIGLLLVLGGIVFGFEAPDSRLRPIRYGVLGASIALTMQLYQRAASIALPPYFNRAEKKAFGKLRAIHHDPETAAAEYQLRLGKVFDNPLPQLWADSRRA